MEVTDNAERCYSVMGLPCALPPRSSTGLAEDVHAYHRALWSPGPLAHLHSQNNLTTHRPIGQVLIEDHDVQISCISVDLGKSSSRGSASGLRALARAPVHTLESQRQPPGRSIPPLLSPACCYRINVRGETRHFCPH